jgi:glutathione S-transferase
VSVTDWRPWRRGRCAPPSISRGNPFGRVPVMEHGDVRLHETQAIPRYLDRALPLTPSQPRAAGRMDQLMNVNDWSLVQGVATVIAVQRIVAPRLLGLGPDEAAIAAAMPKAHAVFDELARRLGETPVFVGDAPGLADVLLTPQLDFFSATPEWDALTAKHANLRRWLARMNARPSMAATARGRVAAMAKVA